MVTGFRNKTVYKYQKKFLMISINDMKKSDDYLGIFAKRNTE